MSTAAAPAYAAIALAFKVPGRPQQRGSKRAFPFKRRNGTLGVSMADDNKNSGEWMGRVADAASQAMVGRSLIDGPVAVRFVFHFTRPKSHFGTGRNADRLKPSAPHYHTQTPDLAKLIRAMEDAMTGIVWRDDRQVCRYMDHTDKRWTLDESCAEVDVYEL